MTSESSIASPTRLAPATARPDLKAACSAWGHQLVTAIRACDIPRAASLFHTDATWRDLLTVAWDFTNVAGAHAIADRIVGAPPPQDVELSPHLPPRQDAATGSIFCYFDVTTQRGREAWVVELHEDDDGTTRAAALLTQLDALAGRPWLVGAQRPAGRANHEVPGRARWAAQRAEHADFKDTDPEVVVVGAGHCGLSIAARLTALGIRTLVLEKCQRVGDSWRNRYPSLTLHDPVSVDHLPYLPFPPTWPRFTPRDKFADFLEFYASALDLNVWTGSSIVRTAQEADRERWSLVVRRPDGSTRSITTAHLVMATGWMGAPLAPSLPGADQFGGTVLHSGSFQGGEPWAGRSAVVVGTGNSGHDIAQDLCEHGAAVTLLQRSPTYVVSSSTFHSIWWRRWDDGEHTTEEADLLAAVHNLDWSLARQDDLVLRAAERDAELIGGLHRAGFRTDLGYANKGTMGSSTFKQTANFHQDMGAAQLIIDGKIRVRSGSGAVGLSSTGLMLDDGSHLEADLVVLATGYSGIFETTRAMLGPIADSCEGVYGLGDDGERRIVWRRSPVDGLWFMTGNIQAARYYSKLLALQIAATLEGDMAYQAETDR